MKKICNFKSLYHSVPSGTKLLVLVGTNWYQGYNLKWSTEHNKNFWVLGVSNFENGIFKGFLHPINW